MPPLSPEERPFMPIETAARSIEAMPERPVIRHDETSAYYAPARDFVNLPRPETFETPENYYAVAFHERTHSTGHESRLNRAGVAGSRLAALGSTDYSRAARRARLGGREVVIGAVKIIRLRHTQETLRQRDRRRHGLAQLYERWHRRAVAFRCRGGWHLTGYAAINPSAAGVQNLLRMVWRTGALQRAMPITIDVPGAHHV